MKQKSTLSKILVLFFLVNIATHAYAQKKIGKVSPDLLELGEPEQEEPNEKNAAGRIMSEENYSFKAIDNLQIYNGLIVIEAIAKSDPSALLAELEAIGLQKGSYYGGMVSGLLPVDNIKSLDGLEALQYVRPSYKPRARVGLVTSQGDLAQLSDVARTSYDVDGSGFKVGILSDSWDNLGGQAAGIASGDLPDDIEVLEELPGGGSDEGRAMGEIVYDVAPGSSLAFHTAFLGQADFANGIIDLAIAGSNIIVDDIIYYAEPMFQDGIIGQAADIVVDAGIPYFSSAGNNFDESYESPFNNGGTFELTDAFSGEPVGEYVLHDFDPGEGVDFFQEVTFGPNGGDILLSFQWDDPFASVCPECPGADTDLDVFLALEDGNFNSMFTSLSALSSNIGGDALEILGISAGGPVTAYIVIGKWTGKVGDAQYDLGPNPDPGFVKYVNFGTVSITDYATQSGTSFGHSNAAGAVAVGGVRYDATPEFGANPPLREVFSSSGGIPTFFDKLGNRLNSPEIRKKPEISAPQGANTTFFGFEYEGDGFPNFFGTSASAPHAAGVAALMLEAAEGNLDPAKMIQAMQQSAVDMDDSRTPEFDEGFDFATGAGLLQADAAIAKMLDGPSVYRFVLIDPINDIPIRTLRDGETIEITPDIDGLFNIEALASGDRSIRRVKFELTSDGFIKRLKRSERSAPYALFGDFRGDYIPGILPVANYELKAIADAKRRKGKKMEANTIAFSIELFHPEEIVANARMGNKENPNASAKLDDLAAELLDTSDFVVYPNPSQGNVNFIWNNGLEENVELSIFDTTGRIVEVFNTEGSFEHAIDFSKYKGNQIYIARIVTPKHTEVKRFVVR